MRRERWVWVLLLIIGIWLLPAPVQAQTETGNRVIFGQSYTLPAGHRLKGDLAVFGGAVTLEEESQVEGDIVIAGGSLRIAGRVDGDIAVLGGNLSLLSTAYVDGDVAVLGGSVSRDEGAVVTGEMVTGFAWGGPRSFGWPGITIPEIPRISMRTSGAELLVQAFLRLLSALLLAALMGALAVAVVSIAPEATRRVEDAMLVSPGLSLIVGVITLILVFGLVGFLAITICLLPIAILLTLSLMLAMLWGWIALGWILGDRLLRALDVEDPNPLLASVIGVSLISLISRLPCLGALLFMLGASLGLGAVILTRGGTRAYVARQPVAPPPPSEEGAGPPAPPPEGELQPPPPPEAASSSTSPPPEEEPPEAGS